MGLFKDFTVREGMKLELRAEFFNITNSVRFRTPDSFVGDTDFGKVIRIRDDGSIPPDNPFVGKTGARPEIFSVGHRDQFGQVRDQVIPAALLEHLRQRGRPVGAEGFQRVGEDGIGRSGAEGLEQGFTDLLKMFGDGFV